MRIFSLTTLVNIDMISYFKYINTNIFYNNVTLTRKRETCQQKPKRKMYKIPTHYNNQHLHPDKWKHVEHSLALFLHLTEIVAKYNTFFGSLKVPLNEM